MPRHRNQPSASTPPSTMKSARCRACLPICKQPRRSPQPLRPPAPPRVTPRQHGQPPAGPAATAIPVWPGPTRRQDRGRRSRSRIWRQWLGPLAQSRCYLRLRTRHGVRPWHAMRSDPDVTEIAEPAHAGRCRSGRSWPLRPSRRLCRRHGRAHPAVSARLLRVGAGETKMYAYLFFRRTCGGRRRRPWRVARRPCRRRGRWLPLPCGARRPS